MKKKVLCSWWKSLLFQGLRVKGWSFIAFGNFSK